MPSKILVRPSTWMRPSMSLARSSWLLSREGGPRDVETWVRREGEAAHRPRNAGVEPRIRGARGHRDADRAAVLHRGTDVDRRVRRNAAGVEVAALVEH